MNVEKRVLMSGWYLRVTDESVWYATTECEDIPGSPCQTLQELLPAMHRGGKLHLSSDNQSTAFLGCQDRHFIVNARLQLLGNTTSRPVVGCLESSLTQRYTVKLQSEDGRYAKLVLDNLLFRNIDVHLDGVHLELRRCEFDDAHLTLFNIRKRNPPLEVTISDSLWRGQPHCHHEDICVASKGLLIRGHVDHLNVSRTEFAQQLVNIILLSEGHLHFDNIHLSNAPNLMPVVGGLTITPLVSAHGSTVTLQNSLLQNQYHWNPAVSLTNIKLAAFRLDYPFHIYNKYPKNVTVKIENCTFANNERALAFVGQINRINVKDSTFLSNIALHHGAAVLLVTGKGKVAIFRNCTFRNNAAGHIRVQNVKPPGDYFILQGNKAKVNSSHVRGEITFRGAGGVARIKLGEAIFQQCSFFNNTATIKGGTIYAERNSKLKIKECYFANSPDRNMLSVGDIIFSTGKVELRGARLSVQSASNHISVLHHHGPTKWSLGAYDLTIECPLGYGLRVINDSSYVIPFPMDYMTGSYKLNEVSYFCKSCPRFKYSMDRGLFSYRLDKNASGYFVALTTVKHKEPSTHFPGSTEYHDIECKECPYGGRCDLDSELQATPNFWGYAEKGDIKFHLCPEGYCCNTPPCEPYDACAEGRTGQLCGTCADGSTEALYSARCVPNEWCGDFWAWIIAPGSAVLYAVLLLFQQDIRDFIFTVPHRKYISRRLQGRRRRTPKAVSCTYDENTNMNGTDNLQGVVRDAGVNPPEAGRPTVQPKTDIGEAVLIIVLYYFQDAMLFQVKAAFAELQKEAHGLLQTLLLSLFNFQLDVSSFFDSLCLMAGLSPVQKLLALTLFVPLVLLLFGFLYATLRFRFTTRSAFSQQENRNAAASSAFFLRLSTGFMLATLFTYQGLATTAMTLLNCVPVRDNKVLFIEGSIVCYQWWQYAIVVYVMAGVAPFFAVLLIGPGLLREGKIGLKAFFCGCLLPLPFLLHWLTIRLSKSDALPTHPVSSVGEAVVDVIQGPFKELKVRHIGPVCWAGVEVFRRLLLVIIFTFVGHPLVRVLSMFVLCFLMHIHHVHVLPYKSGVVNVLGSISLSALMLVGCVNLVYASFDAAEYIPQGPNKQLVYVLQTAENVLLLWFPLAIMSIILLGLFVKIVYAVATRALNCCRK